jgi:hypothetical protein
MPIVFVSTLTVPKEMLELINYVLFGLFVPVLWYFVGRWFDGRLIPPGAPRSSNFGFVVGAGLPLAAMSVLAAFKKWEPVRVGLFGWLVFGAVLIIEHTSAKQRSGEGS